MSLDNRWVRWALGGLALAVGATGGVFAVAVWAKRNPPGVAGPFLHDKMLHGPPHNVGPLVPLPDTAAPFARPAAAPTAPVEVAPLPVPVSATGPPLLRPVQRLGLRPTGWLAEPGDVAVSPDGATCVFGDRVGGVTVWDVRTRSRVRSMTVPPGGPWTNRSVRLAFGPGGRVLFTGPPDDRNIWRTPHPLRVWDTETGELLAERPVSDFALTDDRALLVTLNAGSRFDPVTTLTVWNAATLRALRSFTYRGHLLCGLAVSPAGDVAVCQHGPAVVALDLFTGEPRWRAESETDPHWGAPVMDLARFSPDGALVAVAEAAGNRRYAVRVREAATGREHRRFVQPGRNSESDGVAGLAFAPDGRRLLVAYQYGGCVWWTLETGHPAPAFGRGEVGPATGVALGPGGDTVVLSGYLRGTGPGALVFTGSARAFQFPPPLPSVEDWRAKTHDRYPVAAPAEPDQKAELAPSRPVTFVPETGVLKTPVPLDFGLPPLALVRVTGFAVAPATGALAVRTVPHSDGQVTGPGELRVMDGRTGKERYRLPADPCPGQQPRFSPDGRLFAVPHADQSVWVWETATGAPRARLWFGPGEDAYRLAFSRDGRYVLSNDFRGDAGLVWDLAGVAGLLPGAADAR